MMDDLICSLHQDTINFGFKDIFSLMFKWFIAFMKKLLENKGVIQVSKNNHYLYKYYFKERSESLGVPLDYFKDPQLKKKKTKLIESKNIRIDNFGPNFFSLIMQS